jgi:hypothetical protein
MRTTLKLEDDVAAAVERLRKVHGIGVSQAVNRLVRAGLRAPQERTTFTQRTHPLGLRIDVANVGEALGLLDGPRAR